MDKLHGYIFPLMHLFLNHIYRYWITEKIKDLPSKTFDKENGQNGHFDFTSVVIPSSWITECDHELEWNNHEMLSQTSPTPRPTCSTQILLTFISMLVTTIIIMG